MRLQSWEVWKAASSASSRAGAGWPVTAGTPAVWAAAACAADAQTSSRSGPSLVTRGAYLAKAADCMPCHTSARDKQFAGGLKLDTPFGAIFSPNITPDPDTGIGRWTYEDYKNAVHAGIRADGSYLYPVMTYDAFTLITEDDLKALWAYFRSVPAVKQQNRGNELNFPFNIRLALLPWRWLFFTEGYYRQNPARGPQWNRGAYLVEALAHCSDCHTPRNFIGATIAIGISRKTPNVTSSTSISGMKNRVTLRRGISIMATPSAGAAPRPPGSRSCRGPGESSTTASC